MYEESLPGLFTAIYCGIILNLLDQLGNVFCFGAAITMYMMFNTLEAVQ